MGRLVWPLAFVVTFLLGWAAAGAARRAGPQAEALQDTVSHLRRQVATLQAQLQAREDAVAARPLGPATSARASAGPASRLRGSVGSGGSLDPASGGTQTGRATSPAAAGRSVAPPATVQAALERFYRYLEATSGTGRERGRQARDLLEELRGMGEAAGQALMQVLATATDSEQRRAAARLLGSLQVGESLPLLRDILDQDGDVLLRRAAASGLRQLQTPESIPVMERLLLNPGEDRMVRLSAAYGLAEAGRPLGIQGLAQVFEESVLDGRGREMAFRALSSLNDDRPLPFMRQVAASGAEPAYRLRAIRYLAAHDDGQALPTLQVVMRSSNEQPSIRDAAANAYRLLGGS